MGYMAHAVTLGQVCIWQGQMLTGGPVWGEVDLEVQATQAELG